MTAVATGAIGAMTPAEAKAVADRLNAEAAMSLVTTTLALPMAYAYLEPGDAVAPTTADDEEDGR